MGLLFRHDHYLNINNKERYDVRLKFRKMIMYQIIYIDLRNPHPPVETHTCVSECVSPRYIFNIEMYLMEQIVQSPMFTRYYPMLLPYDLDHELLNRKEFRKDKNKIKEVANR